MAEIKRLHYYDQQYLREPDFTAEQEYHRQMRYRHNRALHAWGIVEGLTIVKGIDNSSITVAPGMAINESGQEMLLDAPLNIPISVSGNTARYVIVQYAEEQADPPEERFRISPGDRTRWTEKAEVKILGNAQPPAEPGIQLILGRVIINDGKVDSTDDGAGTNKRRLAGVTGVGYFSQAGIGTITPTGLFHMVAESGNNYLRVETKTDTNFTGLRMKNNLGDSYLTASHDEMRLFVGGGGSGDIKMLLKKDGNVGIGTTSPSAKLEVAGEIKANFFKAGQGFANSVTLGKWYRIAENTSTQRRTNAEFTLRDFISGGGHSSLTFRAGISYNRKADMCFTLLNHSMYKQVAFTKVRVLRHSVTEQSPQYLEVFVNRTGNVNFSIYDNLHADGWQPVNWFEVTDVPAGYEAHEFEVDKLFMVGDYEARLTVNRGGNVGIGTTAPQTKLHISGGADAELTRGGFLVLGDLAGRNLVLDSHRIMSRANGGIANLHLQVHGGALVVHDGKNDAESKFIITDDGKVGIGTTAPRFALDVKGSVRFSLPSTGEFTDFRINNANGNLAVFVGNDGNVGIGTTSPGAKLEVVGDIIVQNLAKNKEVTDGGWLQRNRPTELKNATDGKEDNPTTEGRTEGSGNEGYFTVDLGTILRGIIYIKIGVRMINNNGTARFRAWSSIVNTEGINDKDWVFLWDSFEKPLPTNQTIWYLAFPFWGQFFRISAVDLNKGAIGLRVYEIYLKPYH